MKDRMARAAVESAVDAFVHVVGTAHSIHGVGRVLRGHSPGMRIVAVEPVEPAEPAESAVLSGGPTGSNRIEGISAGFVPPLWEPEQVDEIVTVGADEAMARRLAHEEGLFAGTSSGANIVAAIRVAERLRPDATVATILCDSGLRYLSTELYRSV